MWLTAPVIIVVATAAPPVESVEQLPVLLQEEYDLLEALDELEQDEKRQTAALTANKKQLDEVTSRRNRAGTRYRRALSELEKQRKRIRRRIRVYIELKGMKEWQLLLSSSDYGTYMRKRRVLRELIKGDEIRIRAYHDTVRQHREAQTVLGGQVSRLQLLRAHIEGARKKLERDRAIKTALLESIRSEKQFYVKAGRDLDKAAKALQGRIDNFEEWKGRRLWFREQKKQYFLPVRGGRVVKSFGRYVHPRFKTVTHHNGIDVVPGRTGNRRVRAIYWGKIVHAGWLRGFGKTVIVDHTRNDYTLYAHLKRIAVKVGDIVKSRQALGVMGATGSLDGERLYFELRKAGKPVNPMPWFK